MGATAPSRLLPASRDSLQALAIVQETPLAPYLLHLRAAGFMLEDCRLFADGFLLDDRKETIQTVGRTVWCIGDRLEILLHSVAVFQMVFPNSRTL
jgi:hypothetical protein